ncbi:MAG: UDP-N-acetylmuramoyl-L-alanine--D-glutamate ligase, partial [Lachnospiraceae bacterium]|nr:UDP-N-acetylmuramoyl-L-alanine--D-glutamate ligase [Lachnospiraceae bacterium]
MELNGKKILIFGMGVSGKGVAKLLSHLDVSMVLYDGNTDLDKEALLNELNLKGRAEVVTGELNEKSFEGVDILALSPGISINAPYVKMAVECGVKVLGEVEIAYEISKGRLAAITGTNGKTTTTALTGEIMKAAFEKVFVVGNIGTSFASVATETTDDCVIVAEISSFQLESMEEFHPEVSAILNLTPDHLDRHGTFENYAMTKLSITDRQTADETCVINYDDEYLREISRNITPHICYFSLKEDLAEGIVLDGDVITYKKGGEVTPIINRYDMNLLGDHNVENVMAACGIALAMGVDLDVIRETVRNFKAVEHRIEYVCTKNGVKYYNDSKGTNTDAAAKAIGSMTSPTVLIAGGYDKGVDFTDWIMGFNGKVKDMILIGQTAEKIRETALSCGFTNVHMCGDLKEAVLLAADIADEGDSVLLSPACASWGQFRTYEERGRLFYS